MNCDLEPRSEKNWQCSRGGCRRIVPRYSEQPPLVMCAVGQEPYRDCIHLSREVVDIRACESCCGHVRVKLFKCAIHGQCTTHAEISGVKCCLTTCDERVTPSPSRAKDDPP